MMLCKLFWLLLLFGCNVIGRKVKRKDSLFHLNVPPPPQQTSQQQQILQNPPSHLNQRQVSNTYGFEPINQEGYPDSNQQVARYENDYGQNEAPGTGLFLVDNGLRSIAKGSADQATSAVASQNAAGKQAAYVAKSTLAQAAAQAASTVIAVLKGKEILMRRLEEQSAESQKSLENELIQLQQAKRSAKAAQYAAQQAVNHVSVLTAALNNAQSASELAQKSAAEAAAELASQIDMVAQAKFKLEQMQANTYAARLDYEETRDSADKATSSAHEAQLNANDAAVHANYELAAETSSIHDKNDHNVRQINKPSGVILINQTPAVPNNHRRQSERIN